jgi:hypothetical protein
MSVLSNLRALRKKLKFIEKHAYKAEGTHQGNLLLERKYKKDKLQRRKKMIHMKKTSEKKNKLKIIKCRIKEFKKYDSIVNELQNQNLPPPQKKKKFQHSRKYKINSLCEA